ARDIAIVTCLRMELYTTSARADRGVEVGVEQLRTFGIEWSPHPSEEEVGAEYDRLRQRVGERPIETLVNLPATKDPALLALTEILPAMPAAFTDKRLHDLAVLRMANLSLEHGHCDGSPLAFAMLSMAIGPRFGHHHDGFRFGHLGLALVERDDFARFRGRVYCSRLPRLALDPSHPGSLLDNAARARSGSGDWRPGVHDLLPDPPDLVRSRIRSPAERPGGGS